MAQSNAEPAPGQTCAFPSSLPPQLVISWLPVRAVGSALCASAAWHRASATVFQNIAQRRGLRRERADVPWSEVVRRSKKRVAVLNPGKRFDLATEYATALGVLDQGWVKNAKRFDYGRMQWVAHAPRVGELGDFISETEVQATPTGRIRIMAFRADRVPRHVGTGLGASPIGGDGAIFIMGRAGVLIGYPGELGTVNLTAADVETLGVSDLKKELAGRGVKTTAAPTTGPELQDLRKRLIDELRAPGFFGWVYP